MQSIAALGITIPQAVNIILNLNYKNYCSGPETDKIYPKQHLWVFGYEHEGEEIYIKLSDDFGHNIAKCISFHKADFVMQYPYKNGG